MKQYLQGKILFRILLLTLMLQPIIGAVSLYDQIVMFGSATANDALWPTSRGLNWQSKKRVPPSSVAGSPPESDGRASLNPLPSASQFKGMISYGAVATNAMPEVKRKLRFAQVAEPYYRRFVSYYFASTIPRQGKDLQGTTLSEEASLAYWPADYCEETTDRHPDVFIILGPYGTPVGHQIQATFFP